MKYFKPSKVSQYGNVRTVPLTEALKIIGWKNGDAVNVSVPDDHIRIEKIEDSKE